MNGKGVRILVADADSTIREIVMISAREQGWAADEARDGIEAMKKTRRNRYVLLVLELELPFIDGLMVCEQCCSQSLAIIISGKKSEAARLDAFACGASDFLQKPFYPRELMARIKNLLRLSGVYEGEAAELTLGDIRVNLDARSVYVRGERLQLSHREYGLFVFLCRNPDRVFSREALLDMVWGLQYEGTNRTVDTHIKCIRDKIRSETCKIETVWGSGYKLVVKNRTER